MISQKTRIEKIYPLFVFAGIRSDPEIYLGKRIILGFLAAMIGFLSVIALQPVRALLPIAFLLPAAVVAGIASFLLVAFASYMFVYYLIDSRKKMVEGILPDFLLLVSSNVSAGMTPFAAFRNSARKEFGPLSEEIKIAASKSLGTESFSEALKELSKTIASDSLREIVSFFAQSLRSGGKIAKLLETTAKDLRQTQALKKELLSSTRMYVMFVVFVVVIAAPVLLSVSVQFLDMISAIQQESMTSSIEGMEMGFLSTKLSIDSSFLVLVAYALLSGNAVLSSLFIGVISQGMAKNGLRYFPLLLVVSLIVFFASRIAFSGFIPA